MVLGTWTVVPDRGDIRFTTGMPSVERTNVSGTERHLRRPVAGDVRVDNGSLRISR